MAKSRATYIPNKNIQSLNVKNGKRVTEIKNKDILDGAYVRKGVKFKKGGNAQIDVEIVQDKAYGKGYFVIRDYETGNILHDSIEGMRKAYRIAEFENNYNVVYSEGIDEDEEEYAKGGNLAMSIKNNIEKIIERANENQDIKGYDIVLSGYSIKVSPDKRDDFWSDLEDIQQDYNVTFSVTDYDDLAIYTSEYEGDMFRTGGVAGSKHVDVTKGYRLSHGYKAVKGDDKNKNYSKGKPKVRVDKGWRLPKGYEVVEGAYNKKYEDGGMMAKGGNTPYRVFRMSLSGGNESASNSMDIRAESKEQAIEKMKSRIAGGKYPNIKIEKIIEVTSSYAGRSGIKHIGFEYSIGGL